MSTNFLLNIDEVKGPSKEKADAIEIETWSFGISAPTDPISKMPTGAVQTADLSVSKMIDGTSPILLMFCGNNKLIKKATLEVRHMINGKSICYFKVELSNARIRAVQTRATGPLVHPSEAVTISFQKITWTYVDGGIMYEHDVANAR